MPSGLEQMSAVSADGDGMDRNEDDAHAEWSPQDVAWDGLMLTAQNVAGTDAGVPSIDRYYIKGRGIASSGSNGGSSLSSCRVPGCTSDLSRDLAYFRKYRICREHLKSPVLVVEGIPSRFCQQCSRFHHVKEFDGPQRTCRAMLERLRLKRNSSKTQADARSGSRGKDTRPVNGSRRGGSSSRSNSTGKDAEPPRDLATGQQPSPFRLDPTDSGEGIESAAAAGVAASRRSAATSAATAFSLPSSSQHQHRHQQDQLLLQQQQQQHAHLQYRPRQAALTSSPGEPQEPPSSRPAPGPAPGGAAMGASRGGLVDRQELLRLLLSQNAGLLPPRHNPLAAGSGAAAAQLGGRGGAGAGGSGRNLRMPDVDSDLLEDGGGVADPMPPLYRDAPYGFPPAMASGRGMQPGMRGAAAESAPPEPRPRWPAGAAAAATTHHEHPLDRDLGQLRMELNGGRGALEDSLLLQLAISRGYAQSPRDAGVGAGAGGAPGRVLDLSMGQPPAPVGPVLNLGGRVDLSLELQLQDIYREELPRLRLVWRLGTL